MICARCLFQTCSPHELLQGRQAAVPGLEVQSLPDQQQCLVHVASPPFLPRPRLEAGRYVLEALHHARVALQRREREGIGGVTALGIRLAQQGLDRPGALIGEQLLQHVLGLGIERIPHPRRQRRNAIP